MFFPAIDDVSLAGLLYALGDPSRLRIAKNLYVSQLPLTCAQAAAGLGTMPMSTRAHHFGVLRQSGVVFSKKSGRETLNELRSSELEAKFPGLLAAVLEQEIDG